MAEQAQARTITIVGGGTAGWMTATLLSRLFRRGFRIRLIESDEIGTVGVGEATIPAIRDYCQLAGIDQATMIRATQATFKLGIEFVDWREPGHRYIHGFGTIGQDIWWLHTHQLWLRARDRGLLSGADLDFDRFALNCVAARANRFSLPDKRAPDSPLAGLDYAYHFDASLFARFLRAESEGRGVERVEGRIVEVRRRAADGFVEAVVLADGRALDGDLFVDCSGMRALLIGEAMGVAFEDWSRWLPCDRALAVPCESVAPLTPYTRATAREAGWQWRIPLQHRIGNGLVYASAHLSDDAAAARLLGSLDGRPLADPRPVRFRPGRRARAWEGNVVAVGLAAGFLEPLESTSIHLIHTAILRLVALFPDADFDPANIAEYNRQTAFEFTDIRDFLIAHYKVTNREDTPFWAYVKHMDVPDSLAERLELFAASARFFIHGKAELFREESWVQVLIGQGLAMRADPMTAMLGDDELREILGEVVAVNAAVAAAMPDHAAYIARHCQAPPLP
jgi:tryptophan 7-halogenase